MNIDTIPGLLAAEYAEAQMRRIESAQRRMRTYSPEPAADDALNERLRQERQDEPRYVWASIDDETGIPKCGGI